MLQHNERLYDKMSKFLTLNYSKVNLFTFQKFKIFLLLSVANMLSQSVSGVTICNNITKYDIMSINTC